jgi:ketosteroid isomerase-like protein
MGNMRDESPAAFEAASAAFHEALRTNDVEGLFAYVADDVVMMPPGEPVLRGAGSMREWYARFLAQYRTASLTLSNREVFADGQWAVELGTFAWELSPVGGGGSIIDTGNYMQVWKQQSDGQWRFAREIWNSAGPET